MADFTDVILKLGDYRKIEEQTDSNTFVLAIKNILLSKPGNYPLTPGLGMDIEKYLFQPATEETLNKIKIELEDQIAKYAKEIINVNVDVQLFQNTVTIHGLETVYDVVGIAISAIANGEPIETRFLLFEDEETLNIYNETY